MCGPCRRGRLRNGTRTGRRPCETRRRERRPMQRVILSSQPPCPSAARGRDMAPGARPHAPPEWTSGQRRRVCSTPFAAAWVAMWLGCCAGSDGLLGARPFRPPRRTPEERLAAGLLGFRAGGCCGDRAGPVDQVSNKAAFSRLMQAGAGRGQAKRPAFGPPGRTRRAGWPARTTRLTVRPPVARADTVEPPLS